MRASSSLTWGGCTIPGDGGVPAVAVSLTGPTAAHARAQARHAIDAGADVLELRVDLLEEVDALVAFTEAPGEEPSTTDSMVVTTAAAQVLECLRRMADVVDVTPLLLTCRTAAEGGRARLDDSGYGALLCSVLDELAGWEPGRRPSAIDVEVQRGCLPQVCEQAHGLGIDVVASFHEQGETQASAPGQMPIQDVRRCLELLRA